MKKYIVVLLFVCAVILAFNCRRDAFIQKTEFKTENIIIILIDGARYSETWGDSFHRYIPGLDSISKEGVVFTDFGNDGITNTINGHTAITTGFYENLNNAGAETPSHPSFFQLGLEKKQAGTFDAWIIGSKDKLQVLADCSDKEYHGRFKPSTDCGIGGLNTGYREDSVTFVNALTTLASYHPHLAFISFKQPDVFGHSNDWNGYLNSLKQSDSFAYSLWKFLQSDPQYKNKTSVFVTNDHGRHLDNVADGFVSHGDGCAGCRHILLLAAGPDFKANAEIARHYGLTDINATISYMLGIKNNGTGRVMTEAFN